MALDPAGFQQAMDPEAVETGSSWMTTTLAAVPRRCSALALNRARRSSSAAPSPASSRMLRHLVARRRHRRDEPSRSAQFQGHEHRRMIRPEANLGPLAGLLVEDIGGLLEGFGRPGVYRRLPATLIGS